MDTTSPTVSSINRTGSVPAPTSASSVTFTVTFSESVTGVNTADFALALSGGATGTIASVSGTTEPEASVRWKNPLPRPQMLAVTVEDTGVGIGEDDLPRLGEAFFQARASYDRRHDGTGLGLSIVKGLVYLHDGDMNIASRLGEGTRVTVRLPLERDGRRSADPVKLVTERAGDLAIAANREVKKIA